MPYNAIQPASLPTHLCLPPARTRGRAAGARTSRAAASQRAEASAGGRGRWVVMRRAVEEGATDKTAHDDERPNAHLVGVSASQGWAIEPKYAFNDMASWNSRVCGLCCSAIHDVSLVCSALEVGPQQQQ